MERFGKRGKVISFLCVICIALLCSVSYAVRAGTYEIGTGVTASYNAVTGVLTLDSRGGILDAESFKGMGINGEIKSIVMSGESTGLVLPEDCSELFKSCTSLTSVDTAGWDTSNVKNMSYMFSGCSLDISDVAEFDMSKVQNTSYMFYGASLSNNDGIVIDMGESGLLNYRGYWDTGKVLNARGMFQNCKAPDCYMVSYVRNASDCSYLYAGSSFRFVGVNEEQSCITSTSHMFEGAEIGSMDISDMKSSLVEDASYMFADSLIPHVVCDLNNGQDLGKLEDASYMFYDSDTDDGKMLSAVICYINGTTGSLKNMESMFEGAYIDKFAHNEDGVSVEESQLPWIEKLETSHVTSMKNAFKNTVIEDSVRKKGLDLSGWSTANVTDASCVFQGASVRYGLKLSGWNTGNVDTLAHAFDGAEVAGNGLLMDNWDTSGVTDMSYMFNKADVFCEDTLKYLTMESVENASYMFNASQITDASINNMADVGGASCTTFGHFLNDCDRLQYPDISSMDFSGCTDFSYFASECDELVTLTVPEEDEQTSGTDAVTLTHMFYLCPGMTAADLSFIKLDYVTDMDHLFDGDRELVSVDGLDETDISGLKKVEYAFNKCWALADTFDLSGWNVSDVTNMEYVFNECKLLENLNITGWSMANVTDLSHTFNECKKLKDFSDNIAHGLDTSLKLADYAFYDCDGLSSAFLNGLAGINVSSVTNMSYMLSDVENLVNLNWGGYRMASSSGVNIEGLVKDCANLETFSFGTGGACCISSAESVFENCGRLKLLDLGKWRFDNTDSSKKIIDGCAGLYEIHMPVNMSAGNVNHVFTKPEEKNNYVWRDVTDGGALISVSNIMAKYSGHVLKLGYSVEIDKNSAKATAINSSVSDVVGVYYYDSATSVTLPSYNYETTGYTGDGYSVNPGASSGEFAEGSFVSESELVLKNGIAKMYCCWSPIQYTIRFHENGGTGSMADMVVRYDEATGLNKNMFTRADHKFKGWAYTSNGYVQFLDRASVYNLRSVPDTVNLYAVWGEEQSIISFYDRDKNLAAKAYIDTGLSVDEYKYISMDEDQVGITKFAIYSEEYDTALDFSDMRYTFAGWKYLGDNSDFSTADVITGDISIYCDSVPNTYKVYLYYEVDEEPVIRTYTYGVGMELPKVKKKGYTFAGWYEDEEFSVEKESISTTDYGTFTLYAKMDLDEYAITYDLDGGALADGKTNPSKYTVESADFTLNNPTKKGYTFKGWTGTDLSSATGKVTVAKGSVGNRTYKATWEMVEYTIIYDLDGGALADGKTNPSKYTVESADFTLNNPSRKGYTFKGWTGTDLDSADEEVTVVKGSVGNRTYKAVWETIEYAITYDLDGGALEDGKTNPSKYMVESSNFTLNNPSRKGYTFKGWTGTDLSSATEEVTVAKGSVGSRSYKAVWETIEYTITYDLDGGALGDGKTNPSKYTVESADFTLNNPTKKGYTFKGWTGTDLDSAAEEVTVTKGSIGNRTYKATWEMVEYTITYDLDGGALGDGKTNPSKYTVESADFTLNNPTKKGYTFKGWTGTDLSSATGEVTVAKGSVGNRTYKATWETIEYTITYDLGIGSLGDGATNPSTYTVESETFTLHNPSKEGYGFSGWTGTGFLVATRTVTIPKGSIGNLSFTANYKPGEYFLNYDYAGGSLEEGVTNPDSYTVVSEDFTINNPSKKGYDFIGWTYDGKTVPEKMVTVSKGSTGDKYFKSVYELLKYDISINVNGGTFPNPELVPSIYTIEDGDIVLPEPEKTGYDFIGWTTPDDATPVKPGIIPSGSTGDRDFTAEYKVVDYSISYDYAGGALPDGVTNPETYTMETDTFTIHNPVRRGYEFTGWSGTGVDGVSKSVTVEKGSTGDVDLKANWEVVDYALSYDYAGGCLGDGENNPQTYTIEAEDFTINNPSKAGYDFIGWTYDGKTVPEKMVTVSKGSTGDKYFKSVYELLKYDISIDTNGGTFPEPELVPSMYTIEDGDIVLPKPEKKGYRFIGWKIPDSEDFVKPGVIPSGSTGDKSFIAQYEVIPYLIAYDYNGGSLTDGKVNPKTYTIETETFTIHNPVREGYEFTGWSGIGVDGVSKSVTVEKGSTGDMELVANWKELPVIPTPTPVVTVEPTQEPTPTPVVTVEPVPQVTVVPTTPPEQTMQPTPTPKSKVPETYLHATKIINKGSTFKIKLLNTKGCKIKWTQSKKGIVKVKGVTVKTLKKGTTDLVCTVMKKGTIIYRFGIRVKVQKTKYSTVNTSTRLKVKSNTPVLLLDKTVFLGDTVKIRYKKTKGTKITYKVKNKSIATIDKKGVVHPKKEGYTYAEAVVRKNGKKTKYMFHLKVQKPLN